LAPGFFIRRLERHLDCIQSQVVNLKLKKRPGRRERAIEGNKKGQLEDEDFIFFGFVNGFEGEWGYFSLNEMEEAGGPFGLPIERGLYFKKGHWSEVEKRERIDPDDEGCGCMAS
jgi:hypothetical protein